MKIIAATKNKGKLAELDAMLKSYDIELISWDEAGLGDFEIDENGTTCEENSYIKAKTVCDMTGKPALADDTGLFVDAADGEPGINAARYAGEHGNDKGNRDKVRKELEGKDRSAYFVCTIVVYYSNAEYESFEGKTYGKIIDEELGKKDFGYDCIFYSDDLNKTFGEATEEEKNSVSHRSRAIKKLLEVL